MEKISNETRESIFKLKPPITGFLVIQSHVKIYVEDGSDKFIQRTDPQVFAEKMMKLIKNDVYVDSYSYCFDDNIPSSDNLALKNKDIPIPLDKEGKTPTLLRSLSSKSSILKSILKL